MSSLKNTLRFFVKVYLISRVRSFLLLVVGARANRDGWEDRVLLISLEGLGDMIVATGAMKHYKKYFGGKKIYLFANKSSQLDASLLAPFVDEVILVDYAAFAKNPFYGLGLVNALRKIGFRTVIDIDPNTNEINGKMIAISLGAEEVIGYEGPALLFDRPFNESMRKNVAYVVRNMHPRYTRVVPGIEKGGSIGPILVNVLHHYIALYEAITGRKENDYATVLSVSDSARRAAKAIMEGNGLEAGKYAVIDLGSSVAYKNWPPERFAEASTALSKSGLKVVLIGAGGEKKLAEKFKKAYAGVCVDLVGKTTIAEAIALIEKCLLLFSNDTGPVHIAVALKKPSLCILGGGQFGMISLYGYADINKWVYKRTDCFCDNWKCKFAVPNGSPSPCVAAVSVEMARNALEELVGYVVMAGGYPKELFRLEFKNIA